MTHMVNPSEPQLTSPGFFCSQGGCYIAAGLGSTTPHTAVLGSTTPHNHQQKDVLQPLLVCLVSLEFIQAPA